MCVIRFQRGGEVLEAEIADRGVGTRLSAFTIIALGLRQGSELPWVGEGQKPRSIPADIAEVIGEMLIEEIRGRRPGEPIPSAVHLDFAQTSAEFLRRGECTVCCSVRWKPGRAKRYSFSS
jgi:hypothetical protein